MEAQQDSESDNSTTNEASTEEEKGRNEFRMRTYDLEVSAESEVSSLEEIAEICSSEMTKMQKIGLFGEFQELEIGEGNIIENLFGGR